MKVAAPHPDISTLRESLRRDRGLLESAMAVPEASFGGAFLHPTLYSMAAAYAYHIAENQPFVDGNKRAALGAALVFLELNGVSIDDPKGRLYDAMMAIAARKLDKDGLANLLERLANRVELRRLNDGHDQFHGGVPVVDPYMDAADCSASSREAFV